MKKRMRMLSWLLTASMTASCLLPAGAVFASETGESTHIATYTGQIPVVDGVTWSEDVDATDFATAYDTVTITDSEGTEYTVEVVPENLMYFIDSVDSDFTKNVTTEPYEAVKNLVGDELLNQTYDQLKTSENAWGLLDSDAAAKGYTETADKTYTGLYGASNAAGETVSYAVTLPAGKYTITSAHKEWWPNKNRPMNVSVECDGTVLASGTVSPDNATALSSLTFELEKESVVNYIITNTANQAPVVSWVAVVQDEAYEETPEETPEVTPTPDEEAPEQPVLPDGFGLALEDNNGLTLAEGTTTTLVSGCGTVVDVATQWNNTNSYHATVKEAADLFQKTSFTVLMDVRQDAPSGDTYRVDQRVAMTIGNATNSLHLLTYSGKFGYGTSPSGISTNMVTMDGVEQNSWNAVAMTYEEKDGGNGSVIVYVNGVKSAEIEDIGFKLSEMTDLSSTIARTFNTNYLQEGRYDNIIVGSGVLDEETALAETAYRKYVKDHLPVNTLSLEMAVEEAEGLIGEGFTSEGLETALAAAKALLAQDLTTDDQDAVDEAYRTLAAEISKITPTEIIISGSDVEAAAENINGLTYKGFGMLNGNSTSNLLLDYKAENPEAYWEMMEYLFGGEYPLFTHIKMEMGNDGNNSTGAEACTMRYEDEEADASRSPGFVMAADAKKVNPDVKISILRWEMPSWVSAKSGEERYEAIYKWYRETIFDAYEKYGYVVDFVNPDKNETGDPDEDFIKWYENRVSSETEFPDYMDEEAQEAYKNIRIIASDENKGLQIVPSMRSDSELYDAVDIIGFHYRTSATDDYVTMAEVDDKEVWYSEGCATFGYTELQENKTAEYGEGTIGGYQSPLALMDHMITAFDSSRRTHYIFQPAIGSFYEGIQYGHKELLSARDPWSGYIHYDPALYMLEHFAKFAKTGWEDSDTTKNEIWRVIKESTEGSYAGTTNEHATAGIDGDAGYMTLAAPDKSDFSVVFVNNTRNEKTFAINAEEMEITTDSLNLWVTETDSYMQNKGTLEQVNGKWYVTLPAYCVATATTLDTTPERTPEEDIHNEDRDVLDTDADGRTNGVTDDDILYADDFDYEEEPAMEQYNAATGETTEVDYLTARGDEPRYMLDTHGAWIVENGKLKHELSSSVSQWNGGEPSTIVGDFRWMDYSTSMDVEIPDADADTWVRLGVRSQTGMNWNNSGYTLCINGEGSWEFYRVGTKVSSGQVTANAEGKYNLKLTALEDTIYIIIDGEAVGSYQDSNPMLSGRVKISSTWSQVYVDNLKVETIDGGIPYALSMVDGQDDSVTYEGTWSIENPGGGSADNWYRTISSSSTAGSSLSFPIYGTGFSILGANSSSTVLDIYVDGQLVDENVNAKTSVTRGEAYILSDLELGSHEVQVVLKSGTLNVDAIYAVGERLETEEEVITSVITELPELMAVTTEGQITGLPEEVEVLTSTGATKTLPVEWNLSAEQFEGKEYERVYVTGIVQGGTNAVGLQMTVSVPVEVVPEGTVYFIDTVDAQPAADASTESYAAVKSLLGDQLLNQVSDQLKTDSNTWGLVDQDAGTKSYTSTDDKMMTGIYGANNTSGETLSYALTLPAGEYELTSAHHEWWGMTRPMSTSLTIDGTVTDAGSLNLSGSSGDLFNKVSFTLESEQTVVYTITSTGSQAPVISWLAVNKTADYEVKVTELKIVENPVDCEAAIGEEVTFHIVAEGDGLTYQWQYSNANSSKWYNSSMTGNQESAITVEMAKFRDGQKYRCIVTDQYGNSLTSEAAVMTVTENEELIIVTQPVSYTGNVGELARFVVEAQGTNLTYQWQYSNANSNKWYNSSMTGNKSAKLEVMVANYRNGQKYRCIITGENGEQVITDVVTVNVAAVQ